MSEFFCTVNTTEEISGRLSKIFNDSSKNGLGLTAGTGKVILHSNHIKKPLNDIVIKDDLTGSWLALIGMPLVSLDLSKYEKRLQFMWDFFKDSHGFLSNEIDGHFALIGYDAINETSYVANDFNSFIPLFYSDTASGFIVTSSELIMAKLLQSDIDEEGLWQAVNLGVTWGHRTRFEGISKLMPCELLIYNQKNLVKQTYWSPDQERQWEIRSFEKVVDRWKEILKSSVKSFTSRAEPGKLSSDLTGGEDSRLVVAQCHDLNLDFSVRVAGFQGSKDIQIATDCAQATSLDLKTFIHKEISKPLLLERAIDICQSSDGYGSFFSSCVGYASNAEQEPPEYHGIHLCGVPGGEAYRGSYYLRAKLISPSLRRKFNVRAFINLKFMLDYLPGLFGNNEGKWKENIYSAAIESLKNIKLFPAGTQVDHLLRVFQTCLWGLSVRQPFYLPLGLRDMTRSIYQISPSHKKNGKLTKAVTEDLFPKLAFIKTQNRVPTVRKRFFNSFLFWPGYIAWLTKIITGFRRRVLKTALKSRKMSRHHRIDLHKPVMQTLMNTRPYSSWFKSASSMITGKYYNSEKLNLLLSNARKGDCKNVRILGRVINQELACRYVKDSTVIPEDSQNFNNKGILHF